MTGNLLPSPPPRPSSYKQILLTMLFSFLLAGGSCFGFLNTFSFSDGKNSQMGGIFAIGFAFCVLTFLGSLLWLVVKAIYDSIKINQGPK